MALLPSRTKYRKVHKGRIYGTAQKATPSRLVISVSNLSRGA